MPYVVASKLLKIGRFVMDPIYLKGGNRVLGSLKA